MDSNLEPVLLRKTRLLSQALIVSGALNICLLSTFFYFILQEEKVSYNLETSSQVTSHKTAAESLQDTLKAYTALSFEELLLRLENKDHVEEGLSKRDLALAALSSIHNLDVEKALSGTPYEKRLVLFRLNEGVEPMPVTLYTGLEDFQYQAVVNFTKTEKWPLTPKGLFFHLKLAPSPKESSLLDAFYLTSVFENIYNLFNKTSAPASKEQLIAIICSGDWTKLEPFSKMIDFTEDERRYFLLSYIQSGSKEAAKLLYDVDAEFAMKRLDDARLSDWLDLLDADVKMQDAVAKEVLKSFRGEALRKKAAALLYTLAKEPVPENLDLNMSLKKFFPELFIAKKEAAPALKAEAKPVLIVQADKKKASPRIHTVLEGDSLWKIAKRYKVDVEAIKKANQLDTEKLRIGKKLIIPESKKAQGTGS